MTSRARILGSAASAFALIWMLGACSMLPTACPAVGYLYNLDVNRGSTLAADATLEACVGSDCVSSIPGAESMNRIETLGASGWKVTLNTPGASIVLRAHDAAGVVVADQTVKLKWTRVGGSEACGGPMTTPAVTLEAS